ncbi:chitin binding peritrophin-A domain-containing protein [Streptomyces bacillaris]|uniref:chitin binding peritrophin-A domain-containing protein n=1 Tax=Streptomyces bacillaris TaxID=68179 RepID=UPI00335DB6CE
MGAPGALRPEEFRDPRPGALGHGNALKVECPEGTLFSKAGKGCDWEWNVQRENGRENN